MIFLKLRKKELLAKLNKFTKDNYFHSKRQPRTILSENSSVCEFAQLFQADFFSQHEKKHATQLPTAKTRANVEHF